MGQVTERMSSRRFGYHAVGAARFRPVLRAVQGSQPCPEERPIGLRGGSPVAFTSKYLERCWNGRGL
jgi:hypothetical protein